MRISSKIAAGFGALTVLGIVVGIAAYVIVNDISTQITLSRYAYSIKELCLEMRLYEKNYRSTREEIHYKIWDDEMQLIEEKLSEGEKITSDKEVRGFVKEGVKEVLLYKAFAREIHQMVQNGLQLDEKMRDSGRKIEDHLYITNETEVARGALLNARRHEKNLVLYGNRPVGAEEKTYLEKWKEEIGKVGVFGRQDAALKALIDQYERFILERVQIIEKLQVVSHQIESVAGSLLTNADNILEIAQDAITTSKNRGGMFILVIVGLVVIVAVCLSVFITRSITKPLSKGVRFSKKLSRGDFTSTVEVYQKDEMGILASALNDVVSSLGGMIRDIANGVETLSSSSTELSALSQEMSFGAKKTHEKSTAVSSAAEEMSANMSSVAAAIEETSTNVSMIATSTEEMTVTLNEIAHNSEKARGITHKAVQEANSASSTVHELGNAAKEIGKVTETITDISEQTNLLALNATIEAARAGEAGRGFAVVAHEIKELARQTAEATNEIKKKIEGIQNSTEGTVFQITQISKVINDVNDIVSTIATAVEQQSVTTKEIAANVAQASRGIQEVTENMAHSATVSENIADDISAVTKASEEIATSSSQVNVSAEELSRLAEKLHVLASRFKV